MYKRKRKPDITCQLIGPETVALKGKNVPDTMTLEEYETFKQQRTRLDIDHVPLYVIKSFNIPKYKIGPIPLSDKLFPYQVDGVRRAIEFGGRALIGDEMGLGKSLQGISIALYYKQKFCIICPSYLRYNWKNELEKWGSSGVVIKDKKKDFKGNIIISYDIAHKVVDKLKAYKTILCDESHYMKNRKTIRAKKLGPLLKRTQHLILMTGTPALNRPVELFTQMSFIRPFFYPNYSKYVHRYCNAHVSFLGFLDVSGSSNQKELAILLKNTGMVRRLKRDVLKDLPEKIRSIIHVEGKRSPEIISLFDEWKEINQTIKSLPLEEAREASFKRQTLVSELFRLTCTAKIPIVKKVILDILDQNIPFIVFCYHKIMMNALREILPEAIFINGDTPMEKRQDMVNEFQSGNKTSAILSMLAAGTGLTLTACSTIIFAELYFVPGVLLQAEDRCHRIGQANTVDVRYIVAKNTLDPRVHENVIRKIDTLDACIDGRSDRNMNFYECTF